MPSRCRTTFPPCLRTTQPVSKSTSRGLSWTCGTLQVGFTTKAAASKRHFLSVSRLSAEHLFMYRFHTAVTFLCVINYELSSARDRASFTGSFYWHAKCRCLHVELLLNMNKLMFILCLQSHWAGKCSHPVSFISSGYIHKLQLGFYVIQDKVAQNCEVEEK